MKTDGHIHTPFCPHGTSDLFEEYISEAISRGFDEISFTEHAPLPENFIDPTPDKDSGMDSTRLLEYFSILEKFKKDYASKIKINIGLEIDYIEGYESETKTFLTRYGALLDDTILSVHFLKREDKYYCLDFSPEHFGEMVDIFGSTNAIYEKYFDTLIKSINADLGLYKPKRIGHMTLVHKFQKRFPCSRSFKNEILSALADIKKNNLQIDYNGAGIKKPLCGETYPSAWIINEAAKQKIPLIYGSDAHSVKDLEQGFEYIDKTISLSRPTF
ncbi:histidinol-phosphatase HisJ [Cytobacillus sp. S13-E01]|uniref:histidinol-phosphatase HisJ n=1 Tax=Cytobacillus sp. S13-E01 TaxID=3031326 RepID=UPI0023D7CEFB|nr:histidinol-phosphatase HisJ [Cytobacillus sp. S13-E01]MDF0726439.1 histidinol-phosphatase HisJ [Cytobacillus sp. S13-E01]